MVPIYICDDEPLYQTILQQEIEKYIMIEALDMEVVLVTGTAETLVSAVESSKKRGIYFLDVELKGQMVDGFSLGKAIRKLDPRGFIIYVTSHSDLAFETFRYRLEAMDYIEKDLQQTFKVRVRQCLANVQDLLRDREADEEAYFQVAFGSEIQNIPMQQILYFETSLQKHRVTLYAEHQQFDFFDSLSRIEETYPEFFLRVHRSYLVSRSKIIGLNSRENELILKNEMTCPVSRKMKKTIKNFLTE